MRQNTKELKRLLKLVNASDIDGKISCRIQYEGEEFGQAEAHVTALTDEQIATLVKESNEEEGWGVDIFNHVKLNFAIVSYPRSYGAGGGVRTPATKEQIERIKNIF